MNQDKWTIAKAMSGCGPVKSFNTVKAPGGGGGGGGSPKKGDEVGFQPTTRRPHPNVDGPRWPII